MPVLLLLMIRSPLGPPCPSPPLHALSHHHIKLLSHLLLWMWPSSAMHRPLCPTHALPPDLSTELLGCKLALLCEGNPSLTGAALWY